MRKNILITGLPRSGKSTLLRKVIKNYDNKVGFVTNEVRENEERIGFEIETSNGKKSMLADVNYKTSYKVSRYFVNIENLEKIIPEVENFNENDLLFLGEVGQMELFSDKFKQLALKYLDSSNSCIMTLSKVYSDEFTEKIKKRSDVIMVEVTADTRNAKEIYLNNLLKKIIKAKRYISEPSRFTIGNNEASIVTDHGKSNLKKQKDTWVCDCEFFQKNGICSHFIALEEFLKTR